MKDDRLYKMFKYDHSETVGETDQCFDTDNYNDWLQEYVGKLEAKLLTMKLSERQPSTEVSEQPDSKALHIADVVRSFSKQNIISVLEDRKNHFKPKEYYKHERERLTQAINTIKKLVPDF